ncbi:MAG TPA: TonB-dependent receptor [Candidatus Baltobacteraceae bacterium]|nr:TonB-dependent receptor [Candidatus Baltobacteraceae bacterium]
MIKWSCACSRSVFIGLLLLILVLCSPKNSLAQNATITGTVADPSQAPVVSVTVTARNTETNASHSAFTNDSGLYRLVELPAGQYVLTFEKSGFKVAKFAGVTLTVGQILTVDENLEIGTVSSTVEVQASIVPPIELENAQISNLVDAKRMTDLPLLLRDPYSLVLLSPGVTQSNSQLGGFSANGTSERSNNFLLDGVDNNDTEVPGIPSGLNSLNPDSTQEFRVITNNYAAEYGRNNGAVIEAITKSGSNQIHGTAYEFGRYNAMGARDFFNPADGPNGGPQNPYVRNDFGASAGGPIKKDKTFWFGNYEGQRFVTTLTNASTVPTAAFKTGKFTITQDQNGNPITPVNVDVSQANSPNNAVGFGLDPNIQKILALYPTPNGPAVNDISGILFFPSTSRQRVDDFTIKVDHNINTKNILSVRYSYNRFTDPNAFHSDFLPGDLGAVATYQRTQGASIGLTTTLRSNLVNEFHFGANRTNLKFTCTGTSVFDSFGNLDSLGRGPDYLLPGISGFGCLTLTESNGQTRYTGTYQTIDGISYTRGKHAFKFGGEFRATYSNSFDNFNTRQALSFSAFSDFGVEALQNVDNNCPLEPSPPAPPNTPSPCVSRNTAVEDQTLGLLGFVDSQSESQFFNFAGVRSADDVRGFRQREWGAYAQDIWKLMRNLTLSAGLRWEYFGVPFEVNNNLANLFTDASGQAPFTFTRVGPGTGKTLYANQFDNFEPRLGIAWDPFKDGKTSVRAGYGIFHDRVFGNLVGNAKGNPPIQLTFARNPFAQTTDLEMPTTQPTSATVTNIDPNTGLGGEIFPTLFDPNFKTPYSQNWNIGIQRQLTTSLTLEVNYVGVKGTRLFRVVDGNPPQPNLVSQLVAFCVPGNPLNTGFQVLGSQTFGTVDGQCNQSTITFANLWLGAEFGVLPFNAVNNNAFQQPFSTPGAALNKSIGNSTYNGLQVNLQKRLSNGFQIQGAYTFAHSIDDINDPIVPGAGNRSFPRNSFDLAAERGNSDFDVRHRGVVNFIYEPNLGRGRAHLNEGFVGRILEGWSITSVISAQTGHPYDIFGNVDSNHTGLSARATIIGNPAQPAGTDKTFTGPALSAFELTPYNQQPNLSKNFFYGPDEVNVDSALLKNTSITERAKLQLRFEFYNLFNHAQFGQPGNALAAPGTFGLSTSTLTRPDGTTSARQIQVAAKIIF